MAAFEANRGILFSLAMSYVKNHEDAEDVLHDILAQVLLRYQDMPFDPNFKYTGYLYTSIKNTCLNLLRNRKRKTAGYKNGEFKGQIPPDQEEKTLAVELLRIMQTTLDGMKNERYRQLFTLREVDELTYIELGEELGIPQGTVMSGVHRARRQFAETLAKNK